MKNGNDVKKERSARNYFMARECNTKYEIHVGRNYKYKYKMTILYNMLIDGSNIASELMMTTVIIQHYHMKSLISFLLLAVVTFI